MKFLTYRKGRQERKTRTAFVIKHPEGPYLVRSPFFKRFIWRTDIGLKRSKEKAVVRQVIQSFVLTNRDSVEFVSKGSVCEDVLVSGQERIDLRLVVLQASDGQKLLINSQCTLLSEQELLHTLLRRYI